MDLYLYKQTGVMTDKSIQNYILKAGQHSKKRKMKKKKKKAGQLVNLVLALFAAWVTINHILSDASSNKYHSPYQ